MVRRLGSAQEATAGGYIGTGYIESAANQEVMAWVYPMTAFVPFDTDVYGFRYQQTGASGADGGDGKVFIFLDDESLSCDPPIDAVNDDFTSTAIEPSAGGTTTSVFANDDFDGLTPSSTTVDVSLTDLGGLTGATINPNGTISVPAGSASGTYTLTYRICESASTTNCDTAASLVAIAQPVDYSDAPLTGTTYGGASHTIVTGILLGGAVTADAGDYDNSIAAGDADDGVTIPALTQGLSAAIPVGVTQVAANDGYLQGWIDWNGDDDFDDPGEQIATDFQSAQRRNQ